MNNDCKCNKTNVLGLNHLRGTKLLSPKCDKPGIFFTTEIIPVSMGTSEAGQPFAPKNGMFYNTLVRYAADGGRFLYDSEGNYTELTGASTEEIRAIIEDAVDGLATEDEIDDLQDQIDTLVAATDVRDVVGTYADLEAYDTSVLGNNDIVKVLQDETHDGAETYYRWSTGTQSWTYIGELGPYYTKDETNTLVSGKLDANTTFWGQTQNNGAVTGTITLTESGQNATIATSGHNTSVAGIKMGNATNYVEAGVASATVRAANGNVNLYPSGSVDVYNKKIIRVADPTANTDAANKGYIDTKIIVNSGAPISTTVGTVGQLLEDTASGKLYICTDATNPYVWEEVGAGGSAPTVVQTVGTSQTDVMSQDATSGMVYADAGTNQRRIQIGKYASAASDYTVAIGGGASSANYGGYASGPNSVAIGYKTKSGQDGVAIGSETEADSRGVAIGASSKNGAGTQFCTSVGYSAKSNSHRSVALGYATNATGQGSIALGAHSSTTTTGEMNIGSSNTSYGYNSSNYRLLTGLYDPQSDHDAATKGYVDTVAPVITMQSTDPGEGVALAENHFIAVF